MYRLKRMVSSSKNKSFVIALFLLIVGAFAQCSGNEKDKAQNQGKDSSACSKPMNPNGDSELALLMRNMLSSAKSMKELVEEGKMPDKFPEEFLKIHTAKPTDSETKKASFDGFATNYINNLEMFYHSPKDELKQNYNAVINSCVSCHMQHCPGPLRAINKLKID